MANYSNMKHNDEKKIIEIPPQEGAILGLFGPLKRHGVVFMPHLVYAGINNMWGSYSVPPLYGGVLWNSIHKTLHVAWCRYCCRVRYTVSVSMCICWCHLLLSVSEDVAEVISEVVVFEPQCVCSLHIILWHSFLRQRVCAVCIRWDFAAVLCGSNTCR